MAFRELQPALKYSLEGQLMGAIDLLSTKPLDYTPIAAFHCVDTNPKKLALASYGLACLALLSMKHGGIRHVALVNRSMAKFRSRLETVICDTPRTANVVGVRAATNFLVQCFDQQVSSQSHSAVGHRVLLARITLQDPPRICFRPGKSRVWRIQRPITWSPTPA